MIEDAYDTNAREMAEAAENDPGCPEQCGDPNAEAQALMDKEVEELAEKLVEEIMTLEDGYDGREYLREGKPKRTKYIAHYLAQAIKSGLLDKELAGVGYVRIDIKALLWCITNKGRLDCSLCPGFDLASCGLGDVRAKYPDIDEEIQNDIRQKTEEAEEDEE